MNMSQWMRQAYKPGGKKTLTTGTDQAEPPPPPGAGSGEGGARGRARQAAPTMDDWLRRHARGRLTWTEQVDASEYGIQRGHPDPDTGSIN